MEVIMEKNAKKVKRRKAAGRPEKTKRRRGGIIGRILQIVLVVLLAFVLFYVIRNFGEGNKYIKNLLGEKGANLV